MFPSALNFSASNVYLLPDVENIIIKNDIKGKNINLPSLKYTDKKTPLGNLKTAVKIAKIIGSLFFSLF